MRCASAESTEPVVLRFEEAPDPWVRSFSLSAIKCLIVCRGPVRKEAMEVFDAVGVREYGILLSEKDSIVYPQCLAPELRGFRFPQNVHRVPDYMGAGQEEKQQRIAEIVEIARGAGYTHVFAGYGFMAEDAEFIEAIERAGLRFVGPSSRVARGAGAKDEAKKLARRLGNSVTPGVDDISARALLRKAATLAALASVASEHGLEVALEPGVELAELAERVLQAGYARRAELVSVEELQVLAAELCAELWQQHPGRRVRFKHIGGGGGKGQRVIQTPEEVGPAVMDVLAESKVVAPGSNRNFLIELNIDSTRHNEIQLFGNGTWCIALGGRDCSLQMHEQKLLELSVTRELLDAEIARSQGARASALGADRETLVRMETEAERFGAAVGLDSVSTFESIVEGSDNYFMEMNTRIQVEHRVTEMVYGLRFEDPSDPACCFWIDSLIEAMLLVSEHGARLPKPARVPRHPSGAEVRINATNAALEPHAGGTIIRWSPPVPGELRDDQGIGTRNPDTGAFIHYRVAGAYDSNIALVVTHGTSRADNLERLVDILRRTELRGKDLETNLIVHYGLASWLLGKEPMAKPSTRFMGQYLAAVGALQEVVRDVDLELGWTDLLAAQPSPEARRVLASKVTLLTRPVQRLLASAHALGGFLGLHDGKSWRVRGDAVQWLTSPVDVLEALYRYLHLEPEPGAAPSEQIWQDDAALLEDTKSFYASVRARTGAASWTALCGIFAEGGATRDQRRALAGGDEALWEACCAAHRGFALGLEWLELLPRIGARARFLELRVDAHLEPVVPPRFCDPAEAKRLAKLLAPPPRAASDEIVAPSGGHFYSREAPERPPMVEEGQHFVAGQPLFVIEVMKMFNKVLAPCSGTIKKALLKECDGKIVTKGQRIFEIDPDDRAEEETEETLRRRRETVTRALLSRTG